MKYLKIDPFEKHLEEALPDHPSQLYFILMEDPFERRHLAERIAMRLGIPLTSCESDELLLQLESPSMFAEKGVIICDEVAAKELPLGEEWVVIVTGIKPPPFFKKLEKEAVTLDLTGEKPWDRKSRLQRWLLEHAREKRKTLAVDAAAYLVEFSHADFALLFQELEKALVYAGEEKTVTLEMIKTICSLDPKQSGWQLSEAVVWGGPIHLGDTDLYGLVGQLRYQLQLGLQVASGKEPPRASPQKLEKIRRTGIEASYYLEGLKELFNLELKMRSNVSNQGLLLDHFRAKLAARRK
ncbi:MAG: hypothetical protein KFB95_06265 [Simkaniaceae bacterium]|nr:MAG: hypothetical protein KFB95_06265 [Simkaniaceae bacterium]